MKARKLSSGNWNCRIMVNGKSYSFTDPDRRRCLRRASEFAEQCRDDVDNPRLADALESFVESRQRVPKFVSNRIRAAIKTPAKRQIQAFTGYFNAGSGGRTRTK